MKNLKKSFLFFCLLYNSFCFFSQNNLDDLKKLYNESKDNSYSIDDRIMSINKVIVISTKIKNNKYLLRGYNRKSFLFKKQKKYDSAIFYSKRLLIKSNLLNDTTKLELAYKRLADCYRKTDSLLLSIEYYKKHKEINYQRKDTLKILNDLQFIASQQKKIGFLIESENTAVEGLQLSDQIKNESDKIIQAKLGIYNHLGTLYREQENYTKAIDLYNKGLLIAKNKHDIITLYNNIANIFLEKEEFDLAINNFENGYRKSLELKNKKLITLLLSNLGLAQSKINHSEALKNLTKSLNIRKKENHLLGLHSSYIHLAEYYLDRNNRNKVLFYANKAYNISKKTNSISGVIDALSFMIDIDDDSKIVEYKVLTDSIKKARLFNINKHATLKYDYSQKELELKESEIRVKNIEIENKKNKIIQANQRFYKLLFLSIGIFILCVSLLVIFLLKVKNKKEKIQQVYITETRISQKVHDEVANDIFGMMTKLQINESQNAEILDDLERVYVKTRDISKENSIIDFTENFDEILQDLLTSYQNDTVNVMTKDLNKIDWNTISKLKKTAIYRVLQELMTNMKKHSKATITIISFEEKNNKLNINYKDNGIGCIINKNTGLQNTENRIQSVNGSIIFESQTNKGFDVKITI